MRQQLFGGARTALTYAVLGGLCAVTSLAGASAASWGGPPVQLEVDTASVLRANYATGSTLLLPPLSPEVIDSARQDAGAPRPDVDAADATPLVRHSSEGDYAEGAAPAASESTREAVLVSVLPDDAAAHAEPLPPAPSHVTAAVSDTATPTADPGAGGAKAEPRATVSGSKPSTEVPAKSPLSLNETPSVVAEASKPVLQPGVDILGSPLDSLAPAVRETPAPLLEPQIELLR